MIKFPPPWDGKDVKCPGAGGGGYVEASIWPLHYLKEALLQSSQPQKTKNLEILGETGYWATQELCKNINFAMETKAKKLNGPSSY